MMDHKEIASAVSEIQSQKVEQYQRIIAICEGLVLLEDQITDLKTLILKVDEKVSRILEP